MERLKEFRKQKQEKKKIEEKNKKAPWRAGIALNGKAQNAFTFKKEVPNRRRETTTGKPKVSAWKVTEVKRTEVI